MRVVSGSLKGRPLKAVPGSSTRPTTDKVKEAIFNMIGPYFDGGRALDLFGGSGGLGIEALSRGADSCIFVDREQKAVQTIHLNLEACRLKDQAEVYRNDAERALKAILKRDLRFQLVFLDPPYKQQKLKALINYISEMKLVDDGGYIVAEHGTEVSLPDEIGGCRLIKHETYGAAAVSIYLFGSGRMGEN
ncbi:16S rRNA (guanine(966)-N(2))-methyltransferase RsmD [Bacillus mangrovi]|uniref:16S rRNA (Guanine(966)-N(2))-methyltransferase RsmD n=1 Tax=Metabacillus mangrovi TaxID=1491830 RepID=A0A7X2S4F7_9BACI|nr:16S rRNA (guanine(966)-N(2))-methyltransferase RsmD [Metabacillus mangrovi]MTH52611.1 16S rRNA (guanine(966)-N(2))-methyltransferase RsmD [Metabacillus mangrovi]